MKKIIHIVLSITIVLSACKKEEEYLSPQNITHPTGMTYVPDDNFEAYLEENGWGNGIEDDNYVSTDNIKNHWQLNIPNLIISDATGIQDFTSVQVVRCYNNQIKSLKINSPVLEYLYANNNELTSIDLSPNTSLIRVSLNDNQLNSIDISGNPQLINLNCSNNQLTTLNLKNGNNLNFASISCTYSIKTFGNPNLTCITVDNVDWATNNWVCGTQIDNHHFFSENCAN